MEAKAREGLKLKPICAFIYHKSSSQSLMMAVIFQFSYLLTQMCKLITKAFGLVQNLTLLFWCTFHLLITLANEGWEGGGSEMAKIRLMLLMDRPYPISATSPGIVKKCPTINKESKIIWLIYEVKQVFYIPYTSRHSNIRI